MSTAARVLRYVVQVFVAAVAVAAAALIILPRAMGWQGVLVLTGSMEPALETGGVAFVDRIEPAKVRKGDIITFTRPDSSQQVTHRVVEVVATNDGVRFRTKGDANDIPDDWIVRPSQLVGKVQLALPKLGGFVRLFVGNRQQLGLFMALPAAYLVYDDIRRWRAGRRKQAEPPAAPQTTWADTVAVALAANVRHRRVRVTRTS